MKLTPKVIAEKLEVEFNDGIPDKFEEFARRLAAVEGFGSIHDLPEIGFFRPGCGR